MQIFRQLAGNIFFKIILGIVAVSFVFFGVSGFILGNPNSWVAKVGDTTITQTAFNNALRLDREIILASVKSEEAMKYLESEKFKSDVLGRLVNKIMIEKLRDEFGVSASKKIIFQAIAKDPTFKNEAGKFDREKFQRFLAKNGFNEERYVNEVSNEVASTMILQSMSMAIPINYKAVIERENFRQEKRVADVITISKKDVSASNKASEKEIEEFFAQHKHHYATPEMRKVSYISFSRNDFKADFKLTDKDIFEYYEKNKENFMEVEVRSFYQVAFDNKEKAEAFIAELGKVKESQLKSEFARLAKKLRNKEVKDISINKMSKADMMETLANPTFSLALNQVSKPLETPLGFHVFLVNDIVSARPIPFSEVKNSLQSELLKNREEQVIQNKISQIDEIVLASNSLSEVAKKLQLKAPATVTINADGVNEKGEKIKETNAFEAFAENAFTLKEGQVSKIFYAKFSTGFYMLKVEKVTPSHERKLAEVKAQVTQDLLKEKSLKLTKDLAKKIAEELAKDPKNADKVASKFKVKLERNREFPRNLYLELQGKSIPYQSGLLRDLFALQVGEVSGVITQSENDFVVVVLKEIKKSAANASDIQQAQQRAIEEFANEIMTEYNAYLLAKHPVEVNEKFFKNQN